MKNDHPDSSTTLFCHHCAYDLRAQLPDSKCPECGASVAESRRWAAIPRRAVWRDRDPRWRRRMVAGVWVLVLLPLMDVLIATGVAAKLPMPSPFNYRGRVMLDERLISYDNVFVPLMFFIGSILLFAKERRQRRDRLGWTRRWGIICSCVSLLINAVRQLLVDALVLGGIAALFQSMPLKYQPKATYLLVVISTTYLRHGPYAKDITYVIVVGFSSIAVLFAGIPIWSALRSSGARYLAPFLLAPLAALSLLQLTQALEGCLNFSWVDLKVLEHVGAFFWPAELVGRMIELPYGRYLTTINFAAFVAEAVKWCSVCAIALWLSVAQIMALWRRRRRSDIL